MACVTLQPLLPLITIHGWGGEEDMKQVMIAIFVVLVSVMSNAQAQSALSTSDKYPLMAHVKKVDMGQQTIEGTSHNTHVMIAEIDGHTYGLQAIVYPRRYGFVTVAPHMNWLQIGDYPCRPTKKGFEFEYYDENSKLRHEDLAIVSEE
jgi:hypothetical protein